jgi:hypothetical protein
MVWRGIGTNQARMSSFESQNSVQPRTIHLSHLFVFPLSSKPSDDTSLSPLPCRSSQVSERAHPAPQSPFTLSGMSVCSIVTRRTGLLSPRRPPSKKLTMSSRRWRRSKSRCCGRLPGPIWDVDRGPESPACNRSSSPTRCSNCKRSSSVSLLSAPIELLHQVGKTPQELADDVEDLTEPKLTIPVILGRLDWVVGLKPPYWRWRQTVAGISTRYDWLVQAVRRRVTTFQTCVAAKWIS